MSFHLCHRILIYLCWCFAVAYVCYPTLIFDIIVKCDVLSSYMICYYHVDVLSSYPIFYYHVYVLSSYPIFCYHADILSSYMSLCCHVMSYRPCFDVLSLLLMFGHFIWCFAILIIAFVFLTKKHKSTKICEPNYDNVIP